MKKKGVAAEAALGSELEKIKKAGIVAMFADDDLMDLLVLKGGNAMDIVHRVHSRASVDLDFSMRDDLDYGVAKPKLERALTSTFDLEGYVAFDVSLSPRPSKMPDELAAFWGGYLVEFKLISKKRADEVDYDLETMRREAVRLGEGSKFTVDISRHEYVDDKVECELDGYRIFVYSPEMIVCEKLRAICQQMPEYAQVIKRNGLGNQRARDFVDIEALIRQFDVDLASGRARHIVTEMFALKRVPLDLLGLIPGTRDFHALGFEEVRAAMKPGVQIEPFDYYFDFVVGQCSKLESLWHM
ncbi:nucleotidyl transferase AbiEii/AbiGii toxin family protein [Luteimonas viscosa]|nr:nucleotidyl transferase AbiEii/AbiGii toxin family protein [Luteimonas viscosa]